MKWIASVVLLSAFAVHLSAAPPETPAKADAAAEIRYERFTLPNGLEVLLHEDHKLPIVAVDIWYHVGPVKERAGRTGFAHLFEHMMFEGSKHVGEKAHFKNLEAAGATDINGTTSFDRTNYFETIPANELETALWLESDRMGFLLDTLDRTKLANQRDVVRNERRQSIEGRPYGLVDEELYHQLFPKSHPYYADVMGSHADVEAARLADIREFFTQYYVPNNATLAIAGDYDPKTIKAQIEKYFGPIPAGTKPVVTPVETPRISAERRVVVPDTVQLPKVILGWLTPPAFTPGDADADLVARILGSSKSSRMYRELVYKQQIAQSADCYNDSEALASTFVCELIAKPGVTPEKLEAEAEKLVDEMAKNGPTAEELTWSRNKLETETLNGLQRLGGFGGVADQLNYYNQYTGDPGYLPKDLARHEAVTIESAKLFAQKNLGKDQRVVVYGVPGKKVVNDVPRSPEDTDANVSIKPEHSAEYEAAQAWRSTPPAPGPQHAVVLPKPTVFTLPNGLTVYLVERHELPLVSAQLTTLAGSGVNPADRPGLAGFTAALLTEGTTTRSAEQIAREASLLGTDIGSSGNANTAQIGLSLLSKYTGKGLELVADCAQHPAFPAKDVERVRANRLTGLLQQQDNPNSLAVRAGLRALYGTAHPYGYDPLGTAASVKSIGSADLAAFHAAHYGPKDSLLELTGDLTVSEARKVAEAAFGKWNSAAMAPDAPVAPATPTRKVLIVDKPGAPQTALFAFGPGLQRNAADYPAAMVMNTMLGDLFSSRINMNLREVHGYTYGAFSFFRFYRGTGPFIAEAQVRSDVTAPATEQLFVELNGIHSKPLTDAEMRLSKDFIIRGLSGSFETAASVNSELGTLWLYGLPIDYYTTLAAKIEAVSPAEAQEAAARYIRPENLLVIAVGDKAKIQKGLEDLKLGPVESWTEPEGK